MAHRSIKGKFTFDDILRVVDNNDKQRFAIQKTSDGILQIRAVQGHSLKVFKNICFEIIYFCMKYKIRYLFIFLLNRIRYFDQCINYIFMQEQNTFIYF